MEVPKHWRLQEQRYRLVGELCPHCDDKIFPPRDICPHCGGNTLVDKDRGQVYSSGPAESPTEATTINIEISSPTK